MKARYINEKFTEESDAIHDMGIGHPEYAEMQDNHKKLEQYIGLQVDDLDFSEVIETLDNLKKIVRYSVAFYFNRKYAFYLKNNPNAEMGSTFASVELKGHTFNFQTSGPGKMIYIQIIENTGRWEGNIGARTIHSLDWKFNKKCKELGIELPLKKKED